MTDLVREAVARYVADELAEELPSIDQMIAELYGDPLYDGLPSGPEGFVARMRARATADAVPAMLDPVDSDLGTGLFREHAEQVQTWRQRRGPSDRPGDGDEG